MLVVLGGSGCIDKEKTALQQERDRLLALVVEKQKEVGVIQQALASVPLQTKVPLWKASDLTALEQQLVGLEAEIERWKVQKQEVEQVRQVEQQKIDDYRKRYVNS